MPPRDRPLRVASLLPAATETVCALGLAELLVGISHECDWPPGLAGLPVLTTTRLRPLGRSAEIDRDVRALLADVLAVYEVDVDALRAAAPDVIVTQDLCDVCAVAPGDVRRALAELGGEPPALVTLHPTRLADLFRDVRALAAALDATAAGERLVRELEQRIERVRARAAALPARPSVLTVEWLDPVMVGGTWMPELVALAGGTPLVTAPGDHAPTLDAAALRALDPAVVLVKPCGFPLERTLAERDALERLLAALPPRADRAVFAADGNAYFNRPGPRLADSLEILAACVHPDAFEDLAQRHAGAYVRL